MNAHDLEAQRREVSNGAEGTGQPWLRWAGPLLAMAVFAAAVALLYYKLKDYSLAEIVDAMTRLPPRQIALAIGLTALNYSILSGYDGLAVWYLGRPVRPMQIILGSFIGYAMSHNFTWMLGGTTTRFRLYSAWGFSAVEVVKLFALTALTFWIGYCALAGVVFLLRPLPIPPELRAPLVSTFWLGPILLGLLTIYLIACSWNRPIAVRGWRLEFPPLHLAAMQVVVASCDMLLIAGVMYVLMPPETDIGYWRFANVVLLALAAVMVSHVPGGVGVLEIVVLGLVPHGDSAAMFGSLLAFRAIFYLLPLLIAVSLLGGHELYEHFKKSNGRT